MTTQTRKTTARPKSAHFTNKQRDEILALLEQIGGDGHSVFGPELLAAFPKALQDRFIRTIESDQSSYKSTLFDNAGNVIQSIRAFYGLTVQECICADLGLEVGSFNGRGFRAQAACASIRRHFNVEAAA
jgi:hypothetical protein